MKVITKTTVRIGKGKDTKYFPPGEIDVPDAVANDLIKRGVAAAVNAAADDDDKDKDKGSK